MDRKQIEAAMIQQAKLIMAGAALVRAYVKADQTDTDIDWEEVDAAYRLAVDGLGPELCARIEADVQDGAYLAEPGNNWEDEDPSEDGVAS
jgi:hypothetical protein